MKHIATVALMLNLGAAGIYAQPAKQQPVKMTFSGNGGPSGINLQFPGTSTIEENVAGGGSLGSFSFRNISAASASPSSQPPKTCSGSSQIYLPRTAGGGIFRFQDGSLLNVQLIQGGDCIDFTAPQAHCTLTFQVTGGTGRFNGVTGGTLTYTETALPVLLNASMIPVFTDEWGQITGTILGAPLGDER